MYSAFVDLMRRWYLAGKRTAEQIGQLLADGFINQDEADYILGGEGGV